MGNIIWLASFPKSGNTWLRAYLHNLLLNPDVPANINQLNNFCLGEDSAAYYNNFDSRPCTEMTPKEIAEIRPKVHELLTRSFSDSVFVKTHNFLGEDEGVPLVTLEYTVAAIYLVRNPLDVTISYSRHYGQSIDETIVAMSNPNLGTITTDLSVRQIFSSWSKHVNSWTQKSVRSLMVVRYEDLLANPLSTFGGIAQFLGLKPPRNRLKKAIANSSFRALRKQEEKHGFIERSKFTRFFREGREGQWREVLTPEQVSTIVAHHREQMQRFDYVPKGY